MNMNLMRKLLRSPDGRPDWPFITLITITAALLLAHAVGTRANLTPSTPAGAPILQSRHGDDAPRTDARASSATTRHQPKPAATRRLPDSSRPTWQSANHRPPADGDHIGAARAHG